MNGFVAKLSRTFTYKSESENVSKEIHKAIRELKTATANNTKALRDRATANMALREVIQKAHRVARNRQNNARKEGNHV